VRPLLAGIGALRDIKTPLRAALTAFGVTFTTGITLIVTGASENAPGDMTWGPALVVSFGAYINAALLIRALEKHVFSPLPDFSWLARALAANAAMAACVIAISACLASTIAKVGTVPVGIAVYFIAAYCLRIEEAGFL
jgi:hypothetical protein